MTLYVVIFILLALFSTVECCSHFKRRDSVVIAMLFSILFWALSWLRWERGTDWGSYFTLFDSLANDYYTVTHSGYEWGFSAINYLVKSYTDNYTVLLFILATVLFPILGYAICKTSRRPVTSVFVLYCVNLGFIFFTRQSIAMGILLLAFYCIVRQKRWGFVFSILLGALFHYSVLIFLPAYWLFYRKIKTPALVLTILCSIPLAIAINKIALGLLSGLPGFVGAKVAGYLDSGGDFEGFGQSVYRVIAGGLVNRGGILLLALLIVGKHRTQDRYANGLINLYTLGFVLFMMMAPITVALTRIASYYDMMVIFIVPLLFDYLKLTWNKIIVSLFCTVYFAYRLFVGGLSGPYGELLTPYNTIFTKELPMKIG